MDYKVSLVVGLVGFLSKVNFKRQIAFKIRSIAGLFFFSGKTLILLRLVPCLFSLEIFQNTCEISL